MKLIVIQICIGRSYNLVTNKYTSLTYQTDCVLCVALQCPITDIHSLNLRITHGVHSHLHLHHDTSISSPYQSISSLVGHPVMYNVPYSAQETIHTNVCMLKMDSSGEAPTSVRKTYHIGGLLFHIILGLVDFTFP